MMKGPTISYTDCGIPVIVETIPDSKTTAFMVAVNTGSRDEIPEQYGISHLLEHVVFRATKKSNSVEMAKMIEGAGGNLNAFTAKEMTAFHSTSIIEGSDVAKEIVADIVSNPLINKKDTELEKKIVLQEMSMIENEPESLIYDLFDSVVWKGHGLEHSELGTKEIVSRLTHDDLRKYYEERYGAPNLAVFASGNLNPDDIKSWAEENFDDMKAKKKPIRNAPIVSNHLYKHFKRKGEHCFVAMGFSMPAQKEKDNDALMLLNTILGNGTSSRLFLSVREEKALVYSINNSFSKLTDGGSFGSFFSATKDNVFEATMTTVSEYKKLKKEGLTKGELQRSKNMLKGILARMNESTEKRTYNNLINFMRTGVVTSTDDRIAKIEAVTEDDVIRIAEKILDPRKINVVMHSDDVKSMKDFSIDQLDF